ncbi:flagellar basal-body rod protein FlgG [Algicola sagamiensis]|uniref:flagellar basal-body rod protein FlgG n=1 Tax=Algicola sagamiensis TaxID=163869 RepID=UPI0003AAA45C|nr:flagellar basal-body rod protein FlgG [Algicola sagamiensis]
MHAALWISKTGLDAQQKDISVISNNLANASTVGYKKSRAVFEDLLYQNINQPGGQSSQETELPNGLMIGAGAKVVATQKNFTQGNLITTEKSLDVMIQGHGFFEIQLPDGTAAYTRNGQFTMNDQGQIVTSGSGYLLQPEITIPVDSQQITIAEDGQVSVRQQGAADQANVGQILSTNFINPAGLEPIGQNLFIQTGASGDPQQGTPGLEGFGKMVQGALETSNVNVTEELVNLIESQRVYETNSKVISSVDQMLNFAIQQF